MDNFTKEDVLKLLDESESFNEEADESKEVHNIRLEKPNPDEWVKKNLCSLKIINEDALGVEIAIMKSNGISSDKIAKNINSYCIQCR